MFQSCLSQVVVQILFRAQLRGTLRSTYDRDVLTNIYEKLDHRRHRYSPTVTPSQVSLFQYLERYLTCIDVGRLHQMKFDGDEFQEWDFLGKRFETAVTGWARRYNQWDSRRALSCSLIGKETDSPFVRCLKKWITRDDWLRCWHRCPNRRTLLPIYGALSPSWCRHGLIGFCSMIFIIIKPGIVIWRRACV